MSGDSLDLDEIVEAMNHVPADFKVEYKRLIIRAGSKAILPLVKSLITFCDSRRDLSEWQARFGKRSTEEDKKTLLFTLAYTYTHGPIHWAVNQIADLVPRLGPDAYTELFSLLSHRDYNVRLAAALIISADTHVSPQTLAVLNSRVTKFDAADYEPREGLWALKIALAKSGNQERKAEIDNVNAKTKTTFDEFEEFVVGTAILNLASWGDLVNEQSS